MTTSAPPTAYPAYDASCSALAHVARAVDATVEWQPPLKVAVVAHSEMLLSQVLNDEYAPNCISPPATATTMPAPSTRYGMYVGQSRLYSVEVVGGEQVELEHLRLAGLQRHRDLVRHVALFGRHDAVGPRGDQADVAAGRHVEHLAVELHRRAFHVAANVDAGELLGERLLVARGLLELVGVERSGSVFQRLDELLVGLDRLVEVQQRDGEVVVNGGVVQCDSASRYFCTAKGKLGSLSARLP